MHTLESVSEEARHFLASIVESSKDSIISVSFDGLITSWNKAAGLLYGYSALEAVGKPLSMLTLPEDLREILSKIDKIKHSRQVEIFEAERIGKDGHRIFLEVTMSPVKNDRGEVIGVSTIARAITERKQQELSLIKLRSEIEQQARIFNTTLSSITDFAYIFNRDGRFIYTNKPLLDLLGLTLDKVVGKNFFDLSYPDDLAARLQQQIQQVFDTGQQLRDVTPYTSPTGASGFYEYIFTPVFAADGSVETVAGSTRDITERKRVEETLRESEEKFRSIVETTSEWIWAIDAQGNSTYNNPAVESILGYTSEELIGREFRNFMHEEDCRKVEQILPVFIAEKRGWTNLISRWHHKDGSVRYLESNAVPIFNSDGELTGFRGADRDITERIRSEEEKMQVAAQIENQRERLDNILAHVPGVVWEAWGMPDSSTQRIDFVSDYVETMLGYSVEEWISTPNFWLTIVHPNDKEWIARDAAENFLAGQSYTRQFRWMAKDRRTVWVDSQATIICDEAGHPIGMRGINIDITERKRLEDERTKLAAELASEKARLQHIFDNSPSFIVSLRGPDYVFETVNPAYYKLVGQRNLIGLPAREALPELVDQGFLELLNQVYTTGEPFTAREMAARLKSSESKTEEEVYLNFIYMPMREADGAISGILSYGVDVTEQVLSRMKVQESVREQMELAAQLETERARLLSAQSVAKVGSWETDLVTQKINWSAETFRIFETDPNQFQPDHQGFLQFVHPDDRAGVEDAFVKSLDQHSICSSENRIVLADGRIKFIEGRWEILRDEQGKPLQTIGTCQDITERKRAEQQIIESEEKYRIIVETANEGIWLTDVESITTYVNRQMAEMLGYTVDEMVGRPIFDFIFEDDFSAAKDKVTQRIEGESETNEFRLRRKDGSEIITQYNASPIRNQAGEIVGLLSMNTDITERKKAEESIHFQAHLLNTVEQSVIATDLNGIVTYWNQFAEKLYGWTAEEAVGRTAGELTTPEISQEQSKQVMKRLNEGESWTAEVVMQNKAGAHFPVHICTSPVNDDKGNLVGKVGVSIDITKRKNAETALREAEDKYRRLVESSPAIVYLAEPVPPYKTIYISPNVAKFGYTIEEWFSRPDLWISIIHPEDKDRVLRLTENAMQQGLDTNLEYRIIAGDGTIYWLQDRGRFVSDEQGNRTGWQGVILDVTETKGLEEQLRQSQKLESVGLLAGGIAHDFNNMLTAINGYSDLTLRKLKTDDPLRSNIEEIKKAGDRSAALTHQLLAFSRQQVMQPVIIDLNDAISDTYKMLQRVLGEDIQFTTTLNSKVGRIKADPGQLSQIITNLAINARDAMPHGGKLTIETDNVFLEREYARRHAGVLPGAYVMLAVSDNGSGMSDKTKEHIFEPFFTTKEVGQGTGLGLATVYGIVKQSGGNIEVESEEGLGTTFKIYLPRVADQATPEKTKELFAKLPQGTETILLVEDEDLVRHLSRQILEESGYTVIEAQNGLHALEICETGDCKFDLVMTDVVMPQMGGRELAENLRSRLPEIKILFTSGYTDDAVVRKGVIEADTNFIQKPFSPDKLAEKIREILDNN
jgi:PAS domain S-box-containing protein